MRWAHLFVTAVLMAGIGMVSATAHTSAEFCRETMPDHPSDVSGYTFHGRVERVGPLSGLPYISVAVATVYANAGPAGLTHAGLAAGRTVNIYSNPCDGIDRLGMKAGDEVLISTAYIKGGPSTWNTAVWRISGQALRLLVLPATNDVPSPWFTNDRRIRTVHTLAQALALVASGATLPPTDAVLPSAAPPNEAPIFILIAACALGLWLGFRRHTAPR